jgi:hypothetical protein
MQKYLIVIFTFLTACTRQSPYTRISSTIDFGEFQNPSADYRAVPFYSLNDLLDSAELDRQITEFARGGYGGVYLHSRTGLLTEYLGTDWWKAMDAGLKACERNNIFAWFYDEDKWPSGFAGGAVPLKNEEFHAHCLMRMNKSRQVPDRGVVISSDSLYNYISYSVKSGNAWFNGTCYVDLLNPAMVKEFINSSYVPYAERYREYFGNVAKGIFTDEPQFMPITDDVKNDGALPFSPVIIERFKKDHGYDLPPVLGALFESTPGSEAIRLDYFRTLALQLEASFSGQIGKFCASRNIMFTGHYNGEEGLTSVRNNVGDLMLQMRNMQQPGIDHLGLHIDGALYAARNNSSVSNQYGITRRLSEAYGISGQNMSFEDRAWIASWHTLNGINHICPHLALYSMKGTRKRDYPPTLSSQQPYWEYNKLLEDYVARLCYMTTIGKYAAEFLVINPIESEYIEGGANLRSWTERQTKILSLLQTLQETHRDYDLGDEQIMSEIASLKGKNIQVGRQSYRGVILPYMLTIRESTLNLLQRFAARGGKILATELPRYVDGKEDSVKLAILRKIVRLTTIDKLPLLIQSELQPEVTVSGENAKDIWISGRLSGRSHILQITNTSRLNTSRCKVRFSDAAGKMVLLDPASGKGFSIKNIDGYEILLHPAQSYILVNKKLVEGLTVSDEYSFARHEKEVLTLTGNWRGKRSDPNALTLDFAAYSTDGCKKFSKPEPVLGLHERFTRDQYNGPLALDFEFNVVTEPKSCSLVLEQPEMYKGIEVNGSTVALDGKSFYRDHSFISSSVTGLLKKGKNIIRLKLDYVAPVPESRDPFKRYGSEIESVYLTGDFGILADTSKRPSDVPQRTVRGYLVAKPVHHFESFSVTDEKSEFSGDLADKGYPFYCGGFVLEKEFSVDSIKKGKRYFISFPLSEAIIIKPVINGTELPPMTWSPWEVEVTSQLRKGTNSIKLILVNSLRNLLGPHHNSEGELVAVSPESFGGGNTWTTRRRGDDNWYDLRLQGSGSTNIWRDDYCVIPFGLLKDPVLVERE